MKGVVHTLVGVQHQQWMAVI